MVRCIQQHTGGWPTRLDILMRCLQERVEWKSIINNLEVTTWKLSPITFQVIAPILSRLRHNHAESPYLSLGKKPRQPHRRQLQHPSKPTLDDALAVVEDHERYVEETLRHTQCHANSPKLRYCCSHTQIQLSLCLEQLVRSTKDHFQICPRRRSNFFGHIRALKIAVGLDGIDLRLQDAIFFANRRGDMRFLFRIIRPLFYGKTIE
jgi:hypothetical protein